MVRKVLASGLLAAVVVGAAAGVMLGVGTRPVSAAQTAWTCDTPSSCKVGAYACIVVCNERGCVCTVL